MSLLLKWAKRTSTPVITEIYRSNTPLDKAALPAPLVTLSNQETQWLDTTAVQGQTYYYMWVTYNMQHTSPAYSPSTQIVAVQRRGVGPNVLQLGNTDLGYYGDVSQTDLITIQGILSLQNPGSALLATPTSAFTWRKMAYKGKVLYIPNRVLFIDTWAKVYSAGFVYGDLDLSTVPRLATRDPGYTTPQNRRATIAGDQYIIRLMRGYSDDPTRPAPADMQGTYALPTDIVDTTPTPSYSNEYDALWLPNVNITPSAQTLPNFTDSMVGVNNVRLGTICQEIIDSGNILARGSVGPANTAPITRQGLAQYTTRGTGYQYAIILVLELVEG